jgi:hypothetical protein
MPPPDRAAALRPGPSAQGDTRPSGLGLDQGIDAAIWKSYLTWKGSIDFLGLHCLIRI